MSKVQKRKQFFANSMHKELFYLTFLATLVPMLVACACLYYLIFLITAEQIGFPEAIASTIYPASRKVLVILCVSFPLVLLLLLYLTRQITHRMVGPYDRIVRELDECIRGVKKDHIKLRSKDKFTPLVERINLLLDRINK